MGSFASDDTSPLHNISSAPLQRGGFAMPNFFPKSHMNTITHPAAYELPTAPALDIVKRTLWHVPDKIRILLRIPILEVAQRLKLHLEPQGDGTHLVDESQLTAYPCEGNRVLLNELTNDWAYDDWEAVNLPWDFFEVKNVIDLVERVNDCSFTAAVVFLEKEFPEYLIPKQR
jgi:hypothetical protein